MEEKFRFDGRNSGKLTILYLSYYPLSYGIGAAASLINMLEDMPKKVNVVVLEPIRVDLPYLKISLPGNAVKWTVPVPLNKFTSFLLYPLLAFIFTLKIYRYRGFDVVMTMHHPFHALSLIGNVLSRLFRTPHIIDVQDVWRPMQLKINLLDRLSDILEKAVAKVARKDLWVFVASEHKQLLERRIRIRLERNLVYPNCVSETITRKILSNLKRQSSDDQRLIKFIFVGRIGKEYHLRLIDPVILKLRELGYKPVLLVVGHVQESNLPNNALCLGCRTVKETLELIALSDIGIGPLGPTLTAPRKVIEYLTLGIVVIVGKGSLSILLANSLIK